MDNGEPIRVLQMLPGSHVLGGIETFVMSYYRQIDRNRVQFDFALHYAEPSPIEEEALDMGARIFHFTVREDGNIRKYARQLSDLLTEHDYRIMHGHMPGLAPTYFHVARRMGLSTRIAHSHVTATEPTAKGFALRQVMRLIKYEASEYFACSKEAGEFMFGNRPFSVIRNAIDTSRFAFRPQVRARAREALGLSDSNIVFGHVGRFNPQKNHSHLIRVFAEILKNRPESMLLLVGDGPLEDDCKMLASQLGVADKIMFYGRSEDPELLYQAMDVFMMPSIFEGLGIACVEAQCAGLPCVVSSVVPREVKLTDEVEFIDLDTSYDVWATSALMAAERRDVRRDQSQRIAKMHYDIEQEAKALQERYEGYAL